MSRALSGTSATFSGNLNLQGAVTRNINFYDSSNTNINAQIQYDQVASNSGQLLFGTNNAGTFAERMRIYSEGQIGIKGAAATEAAYGLFTNDANTGFFNIFAGGSGTATKGIKLKVTSGSSTIDAMTITSGGNVGIGTSSPSTKLHIIQPVGNDAFAIGETGSNMRFRIGQEASYTGNYINSTNIDLKLITYADGGSGGNIYFYTSTNSTPVERMRINNAGAIKLNSADYGNVYNFSFKGANGGIDCFAALGVATNSQNIINFFNQGNSFVAAISVNASTVSYGTGSDYRLKKDFKDFNGLEKVSAIKVYDFKFKAEGDRMEGVIAHELQEVIPYAVTGYKDEVDAEGNDKIQNVDYSKIVPILIKAIQELKAEIEQLRQIVATK